MYTNLSLGCVETRFQMLSDECLQIVDGGVDWGALADAAANATIVSATISSVFPLANVATLVCGTYAATYYLVNGLID